jgi:hypothetical protein
LERFGGAEEGSTACEQSQPCEQSQQGMAAAKKPIAHKAAFPLILALEPFPLDLGHAP